jgi:hypothetical protein
MKKAGGPGGSGGTDEQCARDSFEFDHKDDDSSRKSRFAKELSFSRCASRSPGPPEIRMEASVDSRTWPGTDSPAAAQKMKRLEDYNDRLYWSDSAEDFMSTTPDDILSKVEEIAEEIYREAMEMHQRLLCQSELAAEAVDHTAPAAVTGREREVHGEGHVSEAETKETCGAITYASTPTQSESGMLSEELRGRLMLLVKEQNAREPHNVPPDIVPSETAEFWSHSFESHPEQCSGDGDERPKAPMGGGFKIERPSISKESSTVVEGVRTSENALSEQTDDGGRKGRTHNEVASTTTKCYEDYQQLEKDYEFRNALEKELHRLRASNTKKQEKIDSLQKWRAYYKEKVESKDVMLEQMDKAFAAELKKKEKEIRKVKRSHCKEVALLDAKHEEAEAKLRDEIKELNLVIEELSKQLYEMEEQFAREGIPYVPSQDDDAGPSSKCLLSAVIGVKEAAHTFTRTFMSYLKQHPVEARELEEQISLESEVLVARPTDYKFLVQSFICRRMFADFDSESFNIDNCMTEIWDVEEHSKACFQEFMTYKKIAETVNILTDNRPHSPFLRDFCFKKFLTIVSESTEEAFFGDYNHSDDIFAGRHPSSRFYESFCKLAVSVWILHRLAFSFHTPARMIPVRKGAKFNPTYMESAVPGIFGDDAEKDENGAAPFEALVGLMVHPGFRVGTSIIRAQVYLVTG